VVYEEDRCKFCHAKTMPWIVRALSLAVDVVAIYWMTNQMIVLVTGVDTLTRTAADRCQ
jgi:hypothetical protein